MEPIQFKGLVQFQKHFGTDEQCRQHLRKILYPQNPRCKKCGKNTFYEEDKTFKGFQCVDADCHKHRSLSSGTMFFRTKIPLSKWFLAIYLFTTENQGLTSTKLAELIDVYPTTAWHLLHRIRKSLHHTNLAKKLCGKVEADETYVGGKTKGGKRGRGAKDKIVFGAVQRNGRAYAKVVPNCSKNTLQPIITKKIRKRAHLITDGWSAYRGLKDIFTRTIVKHSDQDYKETATIEGFWSHLKATIRTHMGVSKKHLQKYVDEVVFKYNYSAETICNKFHKIVEKCFEYTSWRGLIDVPYILD